MRCDTRLRRAFAVLVFEEGGRAWGGGCCFLCFWPDAGWFGPGSLCFWLRHSRVCCLLPARVLNGISRKPDSSGACISSNHLGSFLKTLGASAAKRSTWNSLSTDDDRGRNKLNRRVEQRPKCDDISYNTAVSAFFYSVCLVVWSFGLLVSWSWFASICRVVMTDFFSSCLPCFAWRATAHSRCFSRPRSPDRQGQATREFYESLLKQKPERCVACIRSSCAE